MGEAIFNDVFGRLTWDGPFGCWVGGIDWPPGLHTEVLIAQADDDLAAALGLARDGLDWLQAHEGQARRAVAEQMAAVYHHAWRGEDGPPLTAAELARRLELARIGFEADGSLLLSYDAGDLFGGHVVDGDFGPDRAFRGAGLVG